MNNGELAGMFNEEAERLYPGVYYNALAIDEKYPNGESPIDFYNRIEKGFREIIYENREFENILLVTHSGVINIIYHIVKNIEWNNKQKGFLVNCASIHRVVINNNISFIDVENYII